MLLHMNLPMGGLAVQFVDDSAVNISQEEASTRFEFYDMSFEITDADLVGRFAERDFNSDLVSIYDRFYDAQGRDVAHLSDADYRATISVSSINGISLSIAYLNWSN